MKPTAKALEMRLRLGRLMHEHDQYAEPCSVALAPHVDHPVIMSGYAATCDVDLDRTKLRPWAFGYPLMIRDLPPLYYKHDASQPAGKIEELKYDSKGALLIRANVIHPMARRCNAFSIAAKVIDYTMRDADGPNFYAVINTAELTEISLTDAPANPQAVVKHRYAASASQFHALVGAKLSRLKQLTALMTEETA